MSTRGIYTTVTDIRRKVFAEVARLSYEGQDYAAEMAKLPYKIVQGEVSTHRSSIFLERAIVAERVRLAMGLSQGRHSLYPRRSVHDRSGQVHQVR